MRNIENTKKIVEAFISYFKSKGYQYSVTEAEHHIRLDVSNSKDKNNVNFYFTGKVVPQGVPSPLMDELNELKTKWEANPQEFVSGLTIRARACNTTYMIILPDLRKQIKDAITEYENKEILDNPKSGVEYRAKITEREELLTITQFANGTLWLQGKEGELFDSFCSFVEETANPSDKEIVSRFISSDKEKVDLFASKYTPELVIKAKEFVREKLGEVFDYLEPHDKKYFVASACLVLSDLPLPEYSAYVMPASKGFEGFAKKLLINIGLFASDYFKTKGANFGLLKDKTNPKRKAICEAAKYNESYLDRVSNQIDFCRNFNMHSDESPVTKTDTPEEAVKKFNDINKETREIFEYFKPIYGLTA